MWLIVVLFRLHTYASDVCVRLTFDLYVQLLWKRCGQNARSNEQVLDQPRSVLVVAYFLLLCDSYTYYESSLPVYLILFIQLASIDFVA